MRAARDELFDAFKPWNPRPTPKEANDLITTLVAEVRRETLHEAAERLRAVRYEDVHGDDHTVRTERMWWETGTDDAANLLSLTEGEATP